MSENARHILSVSRNLSDRLSGAAEEIDRVIREISTTTETSGTYWRGVEIRLKAQYEVVRAITRDWLGAKLPKEYNADLAEAIRGIKGRSIKPQNVVDYKTFVNSLRVRQTLRSMLSETMSSLNTGFTTGEATLLRLVRATQQVLLTESRVNKAIESGYIQKGSATASKRALRDALMQKALDGKYVTVVDKNGNPRQYRIDSYAEMVVRAKLVGEASEATISTALAVGSDLVRVSTHNTKCELCAEYEGKIFSISGDDADFPMLDAEPPFHPNCMHSITVVIREALERDGTLQKNIDFSTGETEEHPTMKGFIPVSERELA